MKKKNHSECQICDGTQTETSKRETKREGYAKKERIIFKIYIIIIVKYK